MLKLLAAVSTVSVLAACAAPATAPQDSAAAPTASGAKAPAQTAITGSRLSRTSTDRLVKATDNATFRAGTEIRSLGNDIARPSN
ncbi:MAG: hypothetical protein Q7S90_09125 [Rubrivivax sp.]|nr:hypothetical protein [Rubrivivax sp.]